MSSLAESMSFRASAASRGTASQLDLGVQPYRETWDLQHALHERVRTGEIPDTWIFVEHPPVITLGRNAKADNVLLSRETLAARGIDVVEIERGGDVTYHGPGQLVIYPIRKLERFREVVPLVRALEETVIATCAHFGIQAERWKEHAGVWVGRNQICAIGLAVQKMISLHGIALNVSTALDYDRIINPCGLTDRGLTSISHELGRNVTLEEVKPILIGSIQRVFDIQLVPLSLDSLRSLGMTRCSLGMTSVNSQTSSTNSQISSTFPKAN